jgi:hypothetical protein
MPTWDEARTCPKCGKYGAEVAVKSGPERSKIHVLKCETELCRWNGITWLVQVMSDGTIPVRKPGQKDFPVMPEWMQQRGRDIVREIEEAEKGSGEVRG